MAYRKIITFTRESDASEWPFWATELSGTSADTDGTAFLNWIEGRDDVTLIPDFHSDPNRIGATLEWADENAHDLWEAARSSAGFQYDLTDPDIVNYCSANNITITNVTESD